MSIRYKEAPPYIELIEKLATSLEIDTTQNNWEENIFVVAYIQQFSPLCISGTVQQLIAQDTLSSKRGDPPHYILQMIGYA